MICCSELICFDNWAIITRPVDGTCPGINLGRTSGVSHILALLGKGQSMGRAILWGNFEAYAQHHGLDHSFTRIYWLGGKPCSLIMEPRSELRAASFRQPQLTKNPSELPVSICSWAPSTRDNNQDLLKNGPRLAQNSLAITGQKHSLDMIFGFTWIHLDIHWLRHLRHQCDYI